MLQKTTTTVIYKGEEVTLNFKMATMEYVFDIYPEYVNGEKNNPFTLVGGMVHCALLAAGKEDATKSLALEAVDNSVNVKEIVSIAMQSLREISKIMGGEVAKEPIAKRLKKA